MTAYAPPPAYPVADVRYRNGLGLTSLILGLVALTLCWIPFINYLSVVLGLVGIVLAIVGFARIGKRGANNPVTTAIGALVSALAIVLAFVAWNSFANAVDKSITQFEKDMDKAGTEFEVQMDCLAKIPLGDPEYQAKADAC